MIPRSSRKCITLAVRSSLAILAETIEGANFDSRSGRFQRLTVSRTTTYDQ
ncbi:MAG: hypothetical protein GX932_02545 [Methanomicrobiales archaeon]|nr:hypothetical protein [Methanomicrobiales archaeon]